MNRRKVRQLRGDSSWSHDSSSARCRESSEKMNGREMIGLDRVERWLTMPAEARSEPSGSSPETSSESLFSNVKRRRRSELDSTRASSFLTRGRCSETIVQECRGEERRGIRACRAGKRFRNHHGVVKACSVGSSERSVHDVRKDGVRKSERTRIGLQQSRFRSVGEPS